MQEILNNGNVDNKYKNSYLHEIYRPVKVTLSNFIISFRWIRKYSNEYQCLLEQQTDFLLDSSCWWSETDKGVTFLDYGETGRNLDITTNVRLHHWRTYTMKDEIIYLQQYWEKCVENMHSIIPAYKIRIKNSDGKNSFILLNTLEYFRSMNPENLETNKTLNERDISFEVTNISKENFNITPLANQNLNLSLILQISCTAYPSTPLKSKTKSILEETCNIQPKASTPNPHKIAIIPQ